MLVQGDVLDLLLLLLRRQKALAPGKILRLAPTASSSQCPGSPAGSRRPESAPTHARVTITCRSRCRGRGLRLSTPSASRGSPSSKTCAPTAGASTPGNQCRCTTDGAHNTCGRRRLPRLLKTTSHQGAAREIATAVTKGPAAYCLPSRDQTQVRTLTRVREIQSAPSRESVADIGRDFQRCRKRRHEVAVAVHKPGRRAPPE